MTVAPAAPPPARRTWLWRVAALLLAAAVIVAAQWLWRDSAAPNASVQAALIERCQAEMLRGSCRAMRAEAPTAAAQRVFVAGLGEVDGAAFAALRNAGDAMCAEVAESCRSDWQGNACRIARALYPARPSAALPL